MRNYEEQRNFRRMTLDCAMLVTDPADGCEYAVTARDLSADGISFLARHDGFAAAQGLEVRIEPAATIVPPLRAEIEVIRVSQEGEEYLVAAAIRRML